MNIRGKNIAVVFVREIRADATYARVSQEQLASPGGKAGDLSSIDIQMIPSNAGRQFRL